MVWASILFLGLVGGVFHWIWPHRQIFFIQNMISATDIFGGVVTWGQSIVAGRIAFILRHEWRKCLFWCSAAAALFCLGCLQMMDPKNILKDAFPDIFWSALVVGGGIFLFVISARVRQANKRLAYRILAVAGLCGVVWFWMHWGKNIWWVNMIIEDDYFDAAFFLMSAGVLAVICLRERAAWQTISWFGIGLVMHLVFTFIELGDGDVYMVNLPLAPNCYWEELFQFATLCAYLLGMVFLCDDIQRKIVAASPIQKPNGGAR